MIAKIETLESKLNFPVARRCRKTGCVVVFSDKHTGMVAAASDDSNFEVGYHSTEWSHCEAVAIWEPVELTITG